MHGELMPADPIAVILDRRESLRTRLDEVEHLLALTGYSEDDPDPDAIAVEANPTPRPKALRAARQNSTDDDDKGTNGATKQQAKVARLIQEKGPMRIKDIKTELGIAQGSLNKAITKNPLLERTGPGMFDPWGLSAAGRQAVGG